MYYQSIFWSTQWIIIFCCLKIYCQINVLHTFMDYVSILWSTQINSMDHHFLLSKDSLSELATTRPASIVAITERHCIATKLPQNDIFLLWSTYYLSLSRLFMFLKKYPPFVRSFSSQRSRKWCTYPIIGKTHLPSIQVSCQFLGHFPQEHSTHLPSEFVVIILAVLGISSNNEVGIRFSLINWYCTHHFCTWMLNKRHRW